MNPIWLARNIIYGRRICPSWSAAGTYVRLLYRRDYDGGVLPAPIRFRHPEPIGEIELALRYAGDNFIRGEVFDHRYYDVDLGFEPKRILDLGGHIGLSSIFFSRTFPEAEIVSVEPEPGNAQVLARNFELNGVRAHFLHAAITVEDGEVILRRHDQDFGHQIFDGTGATSASDQAVPGISVPTIMERFGWDGIDLVKMDIEGYEASLMTQNAAWLDTVRAIMMEVHPPFTMERLREVAARHGFTKVEQVPGCVLVTR